MKLAYAVRAYAGLLSTDDQLREALRVAVNHPLSLKVWIETEMPQLPALAPLLDLARSYGPLWCGNDTGLTDVRFGAEGGRFWHVDGQRHYGVNMWITCDIRPHTMSADDSMFLVQGSPWTCVKLMVDRPNAIEQTMELMRRCLMAGRR